MAEPTDQATAPTALASPLTLLLEEEHYGDRQAEEVLLLSFTTDLGFFETFGLGVAQACSARVTIVGDTRMSAPDPRAARRAGRSYLPGLAICRGAFHPKLIVIAGPARATVAIGSGNVTLAGWQDNAELWTVLRGDTDSCPTALIDLAAWLRALPGLVRFSHGVTEALTRTAHSLDTLAGRAAERTTDSVRLVSSSTGRILDQLPAGPVSELAICAPFHDPGALALRALVQRLRPTRLHISYQPGLTQLDGPAVAALAEEIDTELWQDGESRYRHGKLIEWVAEETRYALTGSPNLSGAALLRAMSDGGNCELGVIAPIPATLLSREARVTPAAVRTSQINISTRVSGHPLLLGATRAEEGLHVLFTRVLAVGGHLELSPAAAPPETWERIGEVPSGVIDATVTVAAEGGSRIRLITTSEDDAAHVSNLVFVLDPVRATRRSTIAVGNIPTTRPDELFTHPALAEHFFSDLAALKSELPQRLSASATLGKRRDAILATIDDEPAGWEHYLDQCAGRIGHPLLRFALGLPLVSASADVLPVDWAEETVSDAQRGLADEDTETVAAENPDNPGLDTAAPPNLSHAKASVRRRYRAWCEDAAHAATRHGIAERLLITRLLLWTAAAGAWDREDHSWVRLLSQTVQALGSAQIPPQAEPHLGSLAAVALSVMRDQAPRYTLTPERMAYEQAAQRAAHLLVAAHPDYIAQYQRLLGDAFGTAVGAEHVLLLADAIVQGDPMEEAISALRELSRDVHKHEQRLLHVTGSFGNPLLIALEAVGAVQDGGPAAAWANSVKGRWALCVWERPDLYTIESNGEKVLWRHYRLPPRLSPQSLAMSKSFQAATPVQHGPYIQPVPEALAVLRRLGISKPELPRCDRPPHPEPGNM